MENTYRQLGTQKESRQTERHTLKEIDAKGREKERQTGKEEEIWICHRGDGYQGRWLSCHVIFLE